MVGLEGEKDLLSRIQLFEVINLNADFVPANINSTLKEAAKIDRVDDIAFKDIAMRRATGLFKMQCDVFWTQA